MAAQVIVNQAISEGEQTLVKDPAMRDIYSFPGVVNRNYIHPKKILKSIPTQHCNNISSHLLSPI